MRTRLLSFFCCFFIVVSGILSAQTIENKPQKAKDVRTMNYKFVPSIAEQIRTGTFIPATPPNPKQEVNPRRRNGADIIIGKGSLTIFITFFYFARLQKTKRSTIEIAFL